jgi:hypothetical protein
VHAIHKTLMNRVVLLGPKGIKEQRKVVALSKKQLSNYDLSETQSHKSDLIITSLKELQAQREQALLMKRQREEEAER